MRIAICEDQKLTAKFYRTKLLSLLQKHKLAAEITIYEDGEQLLHAVQHEEVPIDLIYMDIGLPGKDGVEVSQELRRLKVNCEIVFLTARSNSWKDAFYVKALHYLPKDETDEVEFETVFLMAVAAVQEKSEETIVFTCAGESRNVALSKISYFDIHAQIVTVHYGNESFEFYTPLTRLEKSLSAKGFVRTHQSYLVAVQHILRVDATEITLLDGSRIPISRSYRKSIHERFGL